MAPFKPFRHVNWRKLDVPVASNLQGRLIMVTGANAGIGFETALHLARMGSQLILACRRLDAAEEAITRIQATLEEENLPSANIQSWHLDLASLDSVRQFADRCDKELERLDGFIANAGILSMGRVITEDGYVDMIEVNTLCHTLLNRRILPHLLRTADLPPPDVPGAMTGDAKGDDYKPHLTTVSSFGSFMTGSSFVDWLGWRRNPRHLNSRLQTLMDLPRESYKAVSGSSILDEFAKSPKRINTCYLVTKALNILLAEQLLETLSPDEQAKIVINSVDPGLCTGSDLWAKMFSINGGGLLGVLVNWTFSMIDKTPFARTNEKGSRNVVWAVVNDTENGAYIANCEPTEPSDLVLSPLGRDLGERVWEEIEAVGKEKGFFA